MLCFDMEMSFCVFTILYNHHILPAVMLYISDTFAHFLFFCHISAKALSLMWERGARARKMRGKKSYHSDTSQNLSLTSTSTQVCLVISLDFNIPPLSSYCQAFSSGCLLFCLRFSYRCASRLGLDLFTQGLISSLSQELFTSLAQFNLCSNDFQQQISADHGLHLQRYGGNCVDCMGILAITTKK